MTLKKIRLLQVFFENDINPWEVPAFRGQSLQLQAKSTFFFTITKKTSFVTVIRSFNTNRFRKPMIMSLDEGVDEIHHFFENMQLGIILGERPYEMKISNLYLNQQVMQVWDKMWEYRIDNWLALNSENYRKYQTLEGLNENLDMLSKTMVGNILSFAKGIGWTIDKEIKLLITRLEDPKLVTYKGQKLMAFCVTFKTNVYLPNYLGLGKGASTGFGVVRHINTNKFSQTSLKQ